MAQSVIEFLENEFVKLEQTVGVYGVMYELLEKAKEMHKVEIIDARMVGDYLCNNKKAEQYYNETYK